MRLLQAPGGLSSILAPMPEQDDNSTLQQPAIPLPGSMQPFTANISTMPPAIYEKLDPVQMTTFLKSLSVANTETNQTEQLRIKANAEWAKRNSWLLWSFGLIIAFMISGLLIFIAPDLKATVLDMLRTAVIFFAGVAAGWERGRK